VSEHYGATDDVFLTALLADSSIWAEPSPALEDAVVRAVVAAQPALQLTTADAPAPNATKSRRRSVMAVLAVAAAAAVILGATFALRRGTRPDFTAQLASTTLAPRAHASVGITKERAGFRVELRARDLPVLGAGEFYEAWLQDATRTLVPIGTFSSSKGNVTLWSGVSPRDYSVVSVTVQAAGDVPGSSGHVVLRGVARAR